MPGLIHSKAQMRKLFALGARGELKGGTAKAEEMARAEGPKKLAKLPEYKAEGGMMGGMMGDMIGCPKCGHMFRGGEVETGEEEGDEPIGAYEPEEPHEHEPMIAAMKRRNR